MRAHQMKNHEIVLDGRILQGIIFLDYTVIETMCFRVMAVKLSLTQFWVVQEESATEVIHSIFGLRLKLVGDEGYMIACLSEYLWEERLVAPLA